MRIRREWVAAAAILSLAAACRDDRYGTTDKVPDAEIVVNDASVRVNEDGTVEIVLSAEVDPPSAGPLTYTIVTEPGLGELVGSGARWDYSPDPDANGEDGFTWKASASGVDSDTASVAILIDAVNDAPSAQDGRFGTQEDVPVTDRLDAVDVEGDRLTWTLLAAPEHGALALDDATGEFTYTPAHDYTGEDSFLWSALDPEGASTGPIRVDITVADTNDPPTVLADSFLVIEDDSLAAQLAATDPDGDPLIWSVVDDVDHGMLDLNTNLGTFTYAPWPDYHGPDAFVVVASDGTSDSEPVTIEIIVSGVNDPPRVPSGIVEVDEDQVLQAYVTVGDVEGDPLEFTVTSPPGHGTLALDPLTGAYTYAPAANWFGTDDFTVVASDPFDDSAPGVVTIVVRPVNDPPTATSGVLLLTNEDVPVAGSVVGSDLEGDTLAYVAARLPGFGTLTLSAPSGDFVYVPNPDFNGIDSFEVYASDGQAASANALVTVQVVGSNDPPVLTATTLQVVEDVTKRQPLSARDPEGDLLYYLISTQPLHGDASLDSLTGLLTYHPDPNYVGTDVLLYTVSDGTLQSNGVLPIVVAPDGDSDEIPDDADNCAEVANPTQSDVNGNALGDACDCWTEPFSSPLDADLWLDSADATLIANPVSSAPVSVELAGTGAFIESVPLVSGCAAHEWSLDVAMGPPPPELGDSLVISARADQGPWVVVGEVFGTGAQESFAPLTGSTVGLDLAGDEIQWRIEVLGDEIDDVFVVDDFSTSCDTDADLLPDCVETWIPGYDLTVADADGDGWLDGEEHAAGSDPYAADTDLDGIDDPLDNCPTAFNPTQSDSDGNGYGDACDNSIVDDFAAGVLDPAMWVSLTGDGAITNLYAYSDTYSVNLGGGAAILEAVPVDLQACTQVSWDLRLKAGPDNPESTDYVWLEAYDGAAWTTIWTRPGGVTNPNWVVELGTTINPNVLKAAARLRFRSLGTGVGFDDFFLDSIAIGCDSDGDLIPNYKELKVYFTDPEAFDTDLDGLDDGAEIRAGTDPLDPSSP